MNKPNTEVKTQDLLNKGLLSKIHHPQTPIFKLRCKGGGCSFRLQGQQIHYLSMQLLLSLIVIYHHSISSMYLHTSISTSKTGNCYDSKSSADELTLVCIPKVRKNRIRCVMKRRRCPGSTLLSLESHLLTSSIKPSTSPSIMNF